MRTFQEKKQHCMEADRVFEQPAVRAVLRSCTHNLVQAGIRPGEFDILANELRRLVSVAAQTARALALGIDPAELRLTPEEVEVQIAAFRAAYEKPGRELIFLRRSAPRDPDGDGGGRGDD